MHLRLFISALFFLICLNSFGQLDTSNVEEVSPEIQMQLEKHSTAKATWRSVMIPGWGQIYNKKVWKVPIIWAGLGTTIGFAIYNHQQYAEFRDAYYIRIDDDPNTTDPYENFYSASQLITIQTQYRRWRDLSIILAVGVYGYNILDAYIDAHLFYFDITEDLSLNIEPTLLPTAGGNWSMLGDPGIRIQLTWP